METRYGAIHNDDVNDALLESNTNRLYSEHNYSTSSSIYDAWEKYRKLIYGGFLSIMSGVLFTANNFIINQLHVVVSDAVLVRCLLQIIICGFIIYWKDDKLLPDSHKEKFLAIFQGLMGATAFISSLASVSFMPVPDALCIIFASPVVTIILSACILGDKLNSLKCFAGTLLFLGVILVCQPPFLFPQPQPFLHILLFSPHTGYYFAGVALAVTGCCTSGLMSVLNALCEEVSTPVLVCWSAISGLIISIIFSLLQTNSRIISSDIINITHSEWTILFLLAVSGLLAFSTLTHALKIISPNLVTSLRSLELVLAYSVQVALLGESLDTWSCLGAGSIMIGVLVLASQDKIQEIFLYRSRQYYHYYDIMDEYSRLQG